MQKIKMLRDLIGVEKAGKSSSKQTGTLFAQVDVTHNVGVIRYIGEGVQGKFSVGQKVYIGNQREEIRMDGADIMVMKEDNVVAIVEDSDEETQENSKS